MRSAIPLKFQDVPELRHSLLAWYDKNRRDLPWRKTRDPYRIWVSEVMLQQTRVAAVVVCYEQFLLRFPSVEKLAAARESSVLAEWGGLGYYRRARNLHATAKVIRENGNIPQCAESWRALPGVGRYTAAAIASIAFNEPVAVVDGNVERVLRRLLGSVPSKSESWQRAQQFLDQQRPGDFNQAMMELGATVCTPFQPRCVDCPLRSFCRTRGCGASGSSKPRQQKRDITHVLARRGDSILLVRRSAKQSLMPGMWEFPRASKLASSDEFLFSVRHSITVTDYRVQVVDRKRGFPNGNWVKVSRLNGLALTGLTKKILRKAGIIQEMPIIETI
jgi:A/G-specific adenine glycosylase